MRRFRVTTYVSHPILRGTSMEKPYDAIKIFEITLEEGEKANAETFKNKILTNRPNLLEYPVKVTEPNILPTADMKILSWSLIEE